MIRCFLAALTIVLTAAFSSVASSASQSVDARLAPGSGRFDFAFLSAGETRTIPVWYHRPAHAGADASIVFVMHGDARNAQTYRKYWIPLAEEKGFVLLVPEFSRAQFPGSRSYNLGNLAARYGTRYPEAQWGYTAIEDIFDLVRTTNSLSARTYDLYGHSAGGQFVHRLVLFKPNARYRIAIAANPGWYAMPDFEIAYPYGLKNAGIDRETLARAFSRRLIVLLGDQDNDPNHHQLSRTPGALAQGEHRFERGHAFFERAKRTAAEMQVPFAWSLQIAPGVAHSNARIAAHAVAALTAK
jgi:hypothetical protein